MQKIIYVPAALLSNSITYLNRYLLGIIMTIPFLAGAQHLDGIIDEGKAKRQDSLVHFDAGKEYHYLPLTVITGKEKGPVFSIVAGIHGYEYPPIIAVQELLGEINPAKLKGTLIVVPIANVAAFYKRTPFFNPIDGKNLNNAFPGSASGTITDQIAHWITEEVISRSDIFLDIHGGDANEDLLPFVCYYDNKSETEQTFLARQLSETSGMPYIVSYPYTIAKTEAAQYAFKQAVQDGITALSIEAGKLGNVQQENVQHIKQAVYNMLGYMKMYTNETTSKTINESAVFLNSQEYIRVPEKGFFYSTFKSGDTVKVGEELGYLSDEFGKVLHRILAPVNGVILYKIGTPPVNTGETLFCIGYQTNT